MELNIRLTAEELSQAMESGVLGALIKGSTYGGIKSETEELSVIPAVVPDKIAAAPERNRK